jgi:hypothetical protein
MSGVFYIIARVYVMKFEVCQVWFVLFSCVYAMKFVVCQQCFVLLSGVYVMTFETKIKIAPHIPQASLHKHETAQITSHIP